jgi:hypothetical protein
LLLLRFLEDISAAYSSDIRRCRIGRQQSQVFGVSNAPGFVALTVFYCTHGRLLCTRITESERARGNSVQDFARGVFFWPHPSPTTHLRINELQLLKLWSCNCIQRVFTK